MNRTERALTQALEEGTITREQLDRIQALAGEQTKPWLQIAAYTLGGILLLGAALWLFDDIWRMIHGIGLISLLFGSSFALFWAGAKFWDRGEQLAATIFVMAAAALMPAGVHHLWRYISTLVTVTPLASSEVSVSAIHWGRIDGRSLAMALSALVYSLILYRRIPTGPLVFPGGISFWYVLWIIAPAFLGRLTTKETTWLMALCGIVFLSLGLWMKPGNDEETISDPGSQLVSMGAVFLWGAVSIRFISMPSAFSAVSLTCIALNLGYLAVAVILRRAFFAVLGSIGVLYLFYFYFDSYFNSPELLPWVLLACGSLALCFGVWWGKNWQRWIKKKD